MGAKITGGGSPDPLSLAERATPAPPQQNNLTIFARANGATIQLVAISSAGEECVICTLADTSHTNTLTFNLIE
jgi:hypothetical protein